MCLVGSGPAFIILHNHIRVYLETDARSERTDDDEESFSGDERRNPGAIAINPGASSQSR